MDFTIVLIVIQLIFLEGVLSIDNAAVLGAMVTPLSNTDPIPWPNFLKSIGHKLDPILGHQRMAALKVGLLGAYVGRGAMLLIASVVIQNPWLKILGAAYLIHLAFDNLGHRESNEHELHLDTHKKNFWSVVLTVELADLVFSLDNVVAAVSLSDQLWVVLLGVALGILFMRFAAGIFSYAVERQPILKTAAYVLVLNIGIELLLEELAGVHFSDWARFGISIGTIVLSLVYAQVKFLHHLKPVFVWVAQGFAKINAIIEWLLVPVLLLVKLPFRLGRLLFPSKPVPNHQPGD
ncbi:MAG TPA: hypothetical protein VFF68_12530 [Anaerolineaceae bacterium]|nr:hypothetical protein [Anaerolineaceae bacterium]